MKDLSTVSLFFRCIILFSNQARPKRFTSKDKLTLLKFFPKYGSFLYMEYQ